MNEVRLIDANELEIELTKQKAHLDDKATHTTIESDRMMYVNTATGLLHAINILHNASTVNDCPNCEYKINYDYICSSSSYKELQALRKFKKDNERPQGEWIKWNFKTFGAMGDWEYKCSNCEKVYEGEYNFCPNCGADMKGGAE